MPIRICLVITSVVSTGRKSCASIRTRTLFFKKRWGIFLNRAADCIERMVSVFVSLSRVILTIAFRSGGNALL